MRIHRPISDGSSVEAPVRAPSTAPDGSRLAPSTDWPVTDAAGATLASRTAAVTAAAEAAVPVDPAVPADAAVLVDVAVPVDAAVPADVVVPVDAVVPDVPDEADGSDTVDFESINFFSF